MSRLRRDGADEGVGEPFPIPTPQESRRGKRHRTVTSRTVELIHRCPSHTRPMTQRVRSCSFSLTLGFPLALLLFGRAGKAMAAPLTTATVTESPFPNLVEGFVPGQVMRPTLPAPNFMRRWTFLWVVSAIFILSRALYAAPPAPAASEVPEVPWTVPTLLKRVPPLRHDATGRFPMICIEPFKLDATDNSFAEAKPLPPPIIHELARRGLTQWIPPRENYIPFALALQQNGAQVVMMEGNAFNGPAGEVPDGLHHLPADFKRDPDQPAQQPSYPCPLLLEGWRKKADELRATFRKFKDAGVHVDAVWLDWEIEPYPGKSQWREARACSRCRQMFPPGVLDSFERYDAFITLWRADLFSAYVAAPILETYPQCSITNWEAVISSATHPTPSWSGRHTEPPVNLGMLTAANPVAYGNTAWYGIHWKKEWNWPLDVPHMDRLYTHVMFGEVSGHEENARALAPEKQTIPWVDRFCPDDRDEKIPILSRPRYREILRHIWLRGADGMQIFNPNWFPQRPDRVAIVTEEVEDAQSIYDEMLGFRKFLESGQTMNTAVPEIRGDGPVWSGLRLGDEAVVRTFTQAAHSVPLVFKPFAGSDAVTLDCPPAGATYLLKRDGQKVIVTKPQN